MQRRLIDFGSTVQAGKINEISKTFFMSGILSTTPVIEVARNDAIKINPFRLITPDGIVFIEDETQEIDISLTVDSKNYTIILRHVLSETSGGTAGNIELVEDFAAIDFFDDATVLGWLKYTGGSTPLDSTMIYLPRSLKILESSTDSSSVYSFVPPMNNKWINQGVTTGVIITDGFDGQKLYTSVKNTNTVILTNIVKFIPIVNGKYPPSIIHVTGKADYQANLIVTVFDEHGTEYIPKNNFIVNSDWSTFDMKLPNVNGLSVFQPNTTWILKLEFQLNPNKEIKIQSICVSDYNLPVLSSGEFSYADFNYPYTFERLSSVIAEWNPTTGLPVSPTLGNRYISTYTANGWTINNIYEFNGTVWVETIIAVVNDNTYVVNISSIDVDKVFNGIEWTNEVPAHKILV
jgi:hypothetical protein